MKGLSDIAGPRSPGWTSSGIDRQVVGGWPDWFGYELPAAEGEAWCRLFNDAHARRRQGRAALRAARQRAAAGRRARRAPCCKAAVAAGFPGAMISTLPRGIGSVLDAPDLDPFWAAADETGARHPHPSGYRRRRRARERLRPGQRRRPHHRRHGRGGAAPLQRPRHALPQRQDLRADGRRRAAVRARPAQAQPRRSRRASPIRPRGWRCSTPTASCTIRGCCDLSSR